MGDSDDSDRRYHRQFRRTELQRLQPERFGDGRPLLRRRRVCANGLLVRGVERTHGALAGGARRQLVSVESPAPTLGLCLSGSSKLRCKLLRVGNPFPHNRDVLLHAALDHHNSRPAGRRLGLRLRRRRRAHDRRRRLAVGRTCLPPELRLEIPRKRLVHDAHRDAGLRIRRSGRRQHLSLRHELHPDDGGDRIGERFEPAGGDDPQCRNPRPCDRHSERRIRVRSLGGQRVGDVQPGSSDHGRERNRASRLPDFDDVLVRRHGVGAELGRNRALAHDAAEEPFHKPLAVVRARRNRQLRDRRSEHGNPHVPRN